jgi:hypothetical protein
VCCSATWARMIGSRSRATRRAPAALAVMATRRRTTSVRGANRLRFAGSRRPSAPLGLAAELATSAPPTSTSSRSERPAPSRGVTRVGGLGCGIGLCRREPTVSDPPSFVALRGPTGLAGVGGLSCSRSACRCELRPSGVARARTDARPMRIPEAPRPMAVRSRAESPASPARVEAGAVGGSVAGCGAGAGEGAGTGVEALAPAAGAPAAGGSTAGGDSGAGGGPSAPRGGRSPNGSTYVSALPTRMPRCTYGTACSGSPVGPGVATTSPSVSD